MASCQNICLYMCTKQQEVHAIEAAIIEAPKCQVIKDSTLTGSEQQHNLNIGENRFSMQQEV